MAPKPCHFCQVPRAAVCGADLSANDFALFYKNTTNEFAHVTCQECRRVLRTINFTGSPGGFDPPSEWAEEDAIDEDS